MSSTSLLVRWLRVQASPLEEPPQIVLLYISLVILMAGAVAVMGIWADYAHANAAVCGTSRCHWFGRSGGFIVLFGACLAFKSGAVLIRSWKGPNARAIQRINPRASYYYGATALLLIAVGTLVWDFGDLNWLSAPVRP